MGNYLRNFLKYCGKNIIGDKMSVIKTENITKIYKGDKIDFKALDRVSIDIKKGELISIVGASGSGKSTLMNILGCLDYADSGKYYLLGKDVSKMTEREFTYIRRKNIGFIFQKFNLIPTLTALENVELPLIYANIPKEKRIYRAKRALETVGLSRRLDHRPGQLSGGQQQRVAVARAIVGEPEIILADEPTGNLDPKNRDIIIGLLRHEHEKGRGIILITHDETTAAAADTTYLLEGGVLHEA